LKTRKEASLRLNTVLESPIPELHDVARMQDLVEDAQVFWNLPQNQNILKDLAQRLIASSFYFKLILGPTSREEGNFAIFGNYS
jgi:hypothetical protein